MPGAYGAHPGTAEHLGWPLPIEWLFPRNTSTSLWTWKSIDCHKWSTGSSFVPLYSLFADTMTPTCALPEGYDSVLHGVLTPCLLGEVSRISFQDEGVNIKNQGCMVVLFKVHWIRSPVQCQLLHLIVFTLAFPSLQRVSKTPEAKVWFFLGAIQTISSEMLLKDMETN